MPSTVFVVLHQKCIALQKVKFPKVEGVHTNKKSSEKADWSQFHQFCDSDNEPVKCKNLCVLLPLDNKLFEICLQGLE